MTYVVFHRCSRKRPACVVLSTICPVIVIVALVTVALHFQLEHRSNNAPVTHLTPTSPVPTTKNGLWTPLSTNITPSTSRQYNLTGIRTVTIVSTSYGVSSRFTTVETSKSVQQGVSMSFTTAILTSTITEASADFRSPIAWISERMSPGAHFLTIRTIDTSGSGISTVEAISPDIPTATLANESTVNRALGHIDLAASDRVAQFRGSRCLFPA